MDVNGTRFHLLLGTGDWLARTDAAASGVAWNRHREELTLVPLPFVFTAAKNDRAPALEDRRGAGRDRFGNWYWIGESAAEILVRSAGTRATSRFWQAGDAPACAREPGDGAFAPVAEPPAPPVTLLQGLAVTDDHYLVVGVVESPALLIFDLHAGGAPRQLCWPAVMPSFYIDSGVRFAPYDMAPRPGGGVWILDRQHARIWALDRRFDVVRRVAAAPAAPPPGAFRPLEGNGRMGAAGADPLAPIRADDAWPAPSNAIAIESMGGCAFVVLDRPAGLPASLHFYSSVEAPPQTVSLAAFGAAWHDVAFTRAREDATPPQPARIYLVAPDGNQAAALAMTRDAAGKIRLERVPEYFPMRLFGGKGLVAAGDQPYYDFAGAWIPLVEQKRPRHTERGEVRLQPLDGREPDCVWHRLLLDGCIPPESSVEVQTRAANTKAELAVTDWRPEPRPYRRRTGSELPFVPGLEGEGAGTWELLFQQARGRYLEVRLVLQGNGRATPRIRALRAYYPRFSYMQYLPGVYREERTSASFLERYLANLEGMLTPIEDRIAAAQALLDVRSAPPETLDWLASWLGLALDPLWSAEKRRLLIAHAMEFFQRRGTTHGLQIALGLTLFDCATPELFSDTQSRRSPAASIRVVERFRTRETPGVVFGDPTDLVGPRIETRRGGAGMWRPREGRARLWNRYVEFLRQNGVTEQGPADFPVAPPADAARATAWRTFTRRALGFVPAASTVSPALWREFLARRYHGVSSLNEVYAKTGYAAVNAFEAVKPPAVAPPDGAPLADWYQFETIVLAMHASAHRFLVLLPMRPSAQADAAEHQARLDVARRIVALEKPAHTTFEVKFYWSLFRIGEARLQLDTLIDRGSRAPDLISPMVLDRGHLGESVLLPSHPQNAADRPLVAGRGRLGDQPC